MNSNISINKYDKLIIFFLALQVFGNVGGALQPIRIFVICCTPFMFIYFLKQQEVSKYYRFERFFFVFWWLYALVALLWAIVPDESVKHIFYFAVNFCGFFVLIWLANNANRPQESIVKGWILLFVLTLPIALYEFWFDWHLPLSVQGSDSMMNFGYIVMERRFASVTFGNLNGYNTMLCYILPFLLIYLLNSYTKKQTIVGWGLLLLLCYLIISNSSRGAVICLIVGLILFLRYYLKSGKSLLVIIVVGLVAVFFVAKSLESMFGLLLARFTTQGFEDVGRMENIFCGIDALINSNLLGVGTGNYMPIMENRYKLEISAPHNLFLEIIVQYGLFVMLGFLYMLWRILKRGLKNGDSTNKAFIVISMCIFPLANIIDSGYLLGMYIWMLLSSLYILSDKRYNYKTYD